jgi:hypothetical protein
METNNIEFYIILQEFNSPLLSDNRKVISSVKKDKVVIINNDVWIEDKSQGDDVFVKPIYSVAFVRINKKIFKKQ